MYEQHMIAQTLRFVYKRRKIMYTRNKLRFIYENEESNYALESDQYKASRVCSGDTLCMHI